MMSIFVSVAAYRDPQLKMTLQSAVENASSPDYIKFGIVNQDTVRNQIDYSFIPSYSLISMHPKDAKGVGYARSKAMSLYSNEDYYLQVDSHTQFVKNWDIKCIEQLTLAQSISGNNKIILSSYPAPYSIENNIPFIHTKSTEEHPIEPTKQKVWLRGDKQWSAERQPFADKTYSVPELSQTVLGGFIFAPGKIVNEVPYDPEISFFGEELCFAVRAWTRGWDIYSPSINLVYHFYKRHGYKKIWSDEVSRETNWDDIQLMSKIKQEKVLRGIEQGTMGVGEIRTLKEYEDFVGIDFNKMYDSLTSR